MTKDNFNDFITRSGLKKKFIAEKVIGTNQNVITKWLAGATMLYPYQQKRLDDFCNDYIKKNDWMKD